MHLKHSTLFVGRSKFLAITLMPLFLLMPLFFSVSSQEGFQPDHISRTEILTIINSQEVANRLKGHPITSIKSVSHDPEYGHDYVITADICSVEIKTVYQTSSSTSELDFELAIFGGCSSDTLSFRGFYDYDKTSWMIKALLNDGRVSTELLNNSVASIVTSDFYDWTVTRGDGHSFTVMVNPAPIHNYRDYAVVFYSEISDPI